MIQLMLEEAEKNIRVHRVRITRLRLLDKQNPFNLPSWLFVSFSRLPKHLVLNLIEELEPSLPVARRSTSIPHHLQVLSFLSVVANGGYQKNVGHDFLLALSQTTISRCFDLVSRAVDQLGDRYIKFPQTEVEVNGVKSVFYENFGFPGIIGAIDCTHIEIQKPNADIEHAYYSGRKKAHTKNVQIVCDYNLKILNINSRYGGTAHDSYVFANSQIKTHLINQYESGNINTWLIGDSGYEQQPWLMTPIREPSTIHQSAYNVPHRKARNCIERCNGVLNGRFRILGKDRILRYTPQKTGTIINACAVLQNIMISANVPITDSIFEDEEDDDVLDEIQPTDANISFLEGGVRTRNRIISEYFS